MADFDNTNRGSIWKNSKKVTDNHPDFTGELNVNGLMFWVSAWKRKEGASDKAPVLSFQIKPKEEKKDDFQKEVKKQGMDKDKSFSDFDDDIPFAPHGKCGAGVSWRAM